MTPVSENGPGPTVLNPHEDPGARDDGSGMIVLIGGLMVALVFLVACGLIGSHFGYKRGFAQGYEKGVLNLNAILTPRPTIEIAPDTGVYSPGALQVSCLKDGRTVPCTAEQLDSYVDSYCRSYREAAARTVKLFEDFRKTEAANRANARLLGWDEGYGVARGDWERPCLRERTPATPRR